LSKKRSVIQTFFSTTTYAPSFISENFYGKGYKVVVKKMFHYSNIFSTKETFVSSTTYDAIPYFET